MSGVRERSRWQVNAEECESGERSRQCRHRVEALASFEKRKVSSIVTVRQLSQSPLWLSLFVAMTACIVPACHEHTSPSHSKRQSPTAGRSAEQQSSPEIVGQPAAARQSQEATADPGRQPGVAHGTASESREGGPSVDASNDPTEQDSTSALHTQSQKRTAPNPALGRTADSATLTVAKGEDGQYTSIAEAIGDAVAGDRILIRPGEYVEKNGLLLDKPLELVGDGKRKEIVVYLNEPLTLEAEYAEVKGLTLRGRISAKPTGDLSDNTIHITGGTPLIQGCDITSETAAAIAAEGVETEPVIRDCYMFDNKVAGIVFDNESRGTVEGCNIYGSGLWGIWVYHASDPIVRNCKIHDGKGTGIDVDADSEGTFENCEVFAIAGPGVHVYKGGDPTFRSCKIYGNREEGVLISEIGYGIFDDCDIFENGQVGVAINDGCTTVLRKCRIHNGSRSGVAVFGAEVTIEECEIFENVDTGISIARGARTIVRGCTITGNRRIGIDVSEGTAGKIENCRLIDNGRPPWRIDPRSDMQWIGNQVSGTSPRTP